MGYVPPRAQRSDESDSDYIAYLESQLVRVYLISVVVAVVCAAVVAIVCIVSAST